MYVAELTPIFALNLRLS